jgi:hypothetical protein
VSAVAIGFTGSRVGTTIDQHRALRNTLAMHYQPQAVLRHGACVGCDRDAHVLAWQLGYRFILHPPVNHKLRAWMEFTEWWNPVLDVVLPEHEYIERNHHIVDAVSLLIATPDGPERERSGTWSTVRYAQKQGVPTVVIMPDGSVLA